MEYKRGNAAKEVGTTPERMDQHVVSPEVGAGPPPDAGAAAPRTPLGILRFAGYSLLIALAAEGFSRLSAKLATIILTGAWGPAGVADFTTQMQFDYILRGRVSAVTLSDFYVGIAIATLLVAWLAGRRGWRALVAWCPIKPGRGRTLMLALATIAYAAGMTLTIEMSRLNRLVDSGPTDLILFGTILANLCVLAPVAEELVFRGWLYTALREKFSFWPSYLATACLFAAIHWYSSVTHMLKVVPLAVVLGLVREWEGSIKPTILVHAIYNLTIVLITLALT